MDFSDLPAAPRPTSPPPTEERKRQRVSFQIEGHFGPKHDPLDPKAQPATFVHIQGLPQTLEKQVQAMPLKSYGQEGRQYFQPWEYKTYDPESECKGKKWQANVGVAGSPLELCTGPGALVKECINNVKGKEIFDDVVKTLGDAVVGKWRDSGYTSTKNKVTVLTNTDRNLVMYGGPTYIFGKQFTAQYPDLKRRKVRRVSVTKGRVRMTD